MSDSHRTEIDGVPVIWAPAEGGLRAGLVFRVGRADETLPRAGITHLLEHLVLHRVERPDMHVNGATSPLTTTFAVHGDADEVRDFFATVCRSLRALPTERLETETDVLRTEAAGKSSGFMELLRTWRYGTVGHGLVGFPEFGLEGLTAEDLQAWSARWFTRGNAVLWVCGGPPPDGLRLDLPDGPRCAPPDTREVLPRTPAYFAANVDGIALEAVVSRSTAATAYATVLDRRLHQKLRRELGISYTTLVAYHSIDAEQAAITAFADALRNKHADVTREFVNILTDLAAGPIGEDELATMRAMAQRSLFDPAVVGRQLAGDAESILLGRPVRSREEVWAEICATAAAEISEVAQEALSTSLVMVPHGQAVGTAGFVTAPTGSAAAVPGTRRRPRNLPDAKQRLVTGPDGISLVDGVDIATVRYDDCVAMLAWPDGARLLFAPDAVTVRVEPQLWDVPASVMREIDDKVPADRVVRMRPRADDAIPRPPDSPTRSKVPSTVRHRRLHRYGPRVLYATGLGSILVTVNLPSDRAVLFALPYFLVAVPGGLIWHQVLKRRYRRLQRG